MCIAHDEFSAFVVVFVVVVDDVVVVKIAKL